MTTRPGWFLAIAAVVLLGCVLAHAGEAEEPVAPAAPNGAPAAEARLPGTGPLSRLARGVGNIVVSPLEIPATMLRVGGERNAFFGFWAGGVEGIGNGLVRFSAGVLETITAPIPSDGLPLYNKRLGERALPPLRPPSGITRP